MPRKLSANPVNEKRRASYAARRASGASVETARSQRGRVVSRRSASNAARNVQRRDRYAEARQSGFSPSEAREQRSWGADKSKLWSKWSNVYGDGFPDSIDERIQAENKRVGQLPHAKYGYRRVYALMVLKIKDVDRWYRDEYQGVSIADIRARHSQRRLQRRVAA